MVSTYKHDETILRLKVDIGDMFTGDEVVANDGDGWSWLPVIKMSDVGTLVSFVEARLGIRLGYKSYVLSITILDEDLNERALLG
ncbi:hypothetical protein L6452_18799 [Arctium lappa]|uniref:Uncharacterized protein n=1 Tax=Arctium lappa TaxID=4217 RepID=A0ACB9C7C2_ARCLA|nr:hypothetical protein L6452_18799 [Arctium lappa]